MNIKIICDNGDTFEFPANENTRWNPEAFKSLSLYDQQDARKETLRSYIADSLSQPGVQLILPGEV